MAPSVPDPPAGPPTLSSLLPEFEQLDISDQELSSARHALARQADQINQILGSSKATGNLALAKEMTGSVNDSISALCDGPEGPLVLITIKMLAALAGAVNELVTRCRKPVDHRTTGTDTFTQDSGPSLSAKLGRMNWIDELAEIGDEWDKVAHKIWGGIVDWMDLNRVEHKNAPFRTLVKDTLYDVAIPTYLNSSVLISTRIQVGDILANSISKHPVNKALLRTRIPAMRLCQILSQSDDRLLCKNVVELAFRLSPSADPDYPDQENWLNHLFPTAIFGTDTQSLRDKFNSLKPSTFTEGSYWLLNAIAAGNIGRAQAFTTPSIRAYPASAPSKLTTFEPTGIQENKLSSAGGGPTLLDWFINQWSIAATVEFRDLIDGSDELEWFPYRFEVPFEFVEKVDLITNLKTKESTLRLSLNRAPLQNNAPIDTLEPGTETEMTSKQQKWFVLFTSQDDQGENQRVLAKVFVHRAQLYPQLRVGSGDAGGTNSTPAQPRGAVTDYLFVPPGAEYLTSSGSGPTSHDHEEGQTSKHTTDAGSQARPRQSQETLRRQNVLAKEIEQLGESLESTSTVPHSEQHHEEEGLEGSQDKGLPGENEVEDVAKEAQEPRAGASQPIRPNTGTAEAGADLGFAPDAEVEAEDVLMGSAFETDYAGAERASDVGPPGAVEANEPQDSEPATELDEVEAPIAQSKGKAPAPKSASTRSVRSTKKQTASEPTRKSSRHKSQQPSASVPAAAPVVAPAPTRTAPSGSAQPTPARPAPVRQTRQVKSKAAVKVPVQQPSPAQSNEDEEEDNNAAGESEDDALEPAAAESHAQSGSAAGGSGDVDGDGGRDEDEPPAGTQPASSLPAPVGKPPVGKQYGKAGAKPRKAPAVKRSARPAPTTAGRTTPSTGAKPASTAPTASVAPPTRLTPRRAAASKKRVPKPAPEESDEKVEEEESDESGESLPPHVVQAKKKGNVVAARAAPPKSASIRQPAKAKAAPKAASSTTVKAKPAPKKAAVRTSTRQRTKAGGKGGRRAVKPLPDMDEPDAEEPDGDGEGEDSDVSTDWDDPTMTRKVKRAMKKDERSRRSTTVDTVSTEHHAPVPKTKPAEAASAPAAKAKAEAKGKTKAAPTSKGAAVKTPAKAQVASTWTSARKRKANEAISDVEEPRPGDRRIAISAGPAADEALSRPMHRDDDGPRKEIQTLSQLVRQDKLPPKKRPHSNHNVTRRSTEEDAPVQPMEQAGEEDDAYQPPLDFGSEDDVPATEVTAAAVATKAPAAEVTAAPRYVAGHEVELADEAIPKKSSRQAEPTADDLIASRARQLSAQSTAPRPSQLVVGPPPDIARTLSPGSIAAVKQLVPATQSDDQSQSVSRKTTDTTNHPASSPHKAAQPVAHASQLTVPAPAPAVDDDIEDADEAGETGDTVAHEAGVEEGAGVTAMEVDDGDAVEEDDEDPITSATAPLSLPTPAQRSALEPAAPVADDQVTEPASRRGSQLTVPSGVEDARLHSPGKLSTIPEGSSSLSELQAGQHGPGAVQSAAVGDVEMGSTESGVQPARDPNLHETSSEEELEAHAPRLGDDSGYFDNQSEAGETSSDRSAPLVARGAQALASTARRAKAQSVPPAPSANKRATTTRPKSTSAVPAVKAESGSTKSSVTVAPPAPVPAPRPAKRPAAVLEGPAPVEPIRSVVARMRKPAQAPSRVIKQPARPVARAPVKARAIAGGPSRASERARAKGKGKQRAVAFRERVSQIGMQTARKEGASEMEVDEVVDRFGLGMAMGEEEVEESEQLLNDLLATFVRQRRLRREAVWERFERSKRFLTNEVALPLLDEIANESTEIIADVEAVVGRWKGVAENAQKLCEWNGVHGARLDAEMNQAKARFGYRS